MAGLEQLGHQSAADELGPANDQNLLWGILRAFLVVHTRSVAGLYDLLTHPGVAASGLTWLLLR
jgi:hypothetical protein